MDDDVTESSAARKIPDPVDVHVGARLKARRSVLSMSQTDLGTSIGLSFQQVQKYELGTNRMGASRLWRIAAVMGVPVSYFFEGLENEGVLDARGDGLTASMNSKEGVTLNVAFSKVHDAALRRRIAALVDAIVAEDRQGD